MLMIFYLIQLIQKIDQSNIYVIQERFHSFLMQYIFLFPAFNNEVQKGRGLNPSPVATKTCIVCLPQQQNANTNANGPPYGEPFT